MRRDTIAATTALCAIIALGALAPAQALSADRAGIPAADPTSDADDRAPLGPGSYRFDVHDMTVDLDLEADYWVVLENGHGRTILSDIGPAGPVGRDVMFVSARRLAGDAADKKATASGVATVGMTLRPTRSGSRQGRASSTSRSTPTCGASERA